MIISKKVMRGLLSLILLTPSVLFAWNAFGHQVIANIAYQQLTPKAKAKVDNLVNVLAREYPTLNSLPKMATWPYGDEVDVFANWHYAYTPVSLDGAAIPTEAVQQDDNARWAIDNAKIVVANVHANAFERARFLALLTHIIGDLHQPLHSLTGISKQHPTGDNGGKLYTLIINNGKSNLHDYWDEAGGVLTSQNQPTLDSITFILTNRYPVAYFKTRYKTLDVAIWVDEEKSMAHAIYNLPEGQAISTDYAAYVSSTCEQQMVIAGYRLGQVLNSLLN